MSDAKSGEEIFKPKCTDQFHTVKKDAGHKQDDWTMSHLRSSNLSVKMFFYAANKAVSVNEADFWEKSYPLRQKLLVPLLKIYLLVSEGDSPTFSPPTIIRAQTPSSVVSQYIRDQALLVTDMVLLSLASCHQKVHRDQAHLNYLLSQSLSNLNFQLLLPVKDLGREVQREMIASIAGVARMIERLDLNSKHTGVSVPLSSSPGGTSNLSYKGKDTKECEITESLNEIVGKNVRGMNSVESPCVKSIIPSQSEASLVQAILPCTFLVYNYF
ncbi:hypothetical protein RHGRI_004643 [Rhododendron griersonianum]|uniref:Uncharacterized protein n=1 Tax=Rhododendron griersonianum TaxID=479676 RepID=A0AAV6LAD9_9ERIC|nr:hypothetical protein RHGRI_004643 [Rhododendron griersonianum]